MGSKSPAQFNEIHRRGLQLLGLAVLAGLTSVATSRAQQVKPTTPAPLLGAPPSFVDGFENAATLADLFPANFSRWTGMQQEPAGNTISLSTARVHSGTQSLKCFAQPYDGVHASKADIYNEILHFVNGQEVWTECWYFLEGGHATANVFLWDLEAPATCTSAIACPEAGNGRICNSPGRRLYLSGPDGRWLKSDMGKWCIGQNFEQDAGHEVNLPLDQWVRVRVYMRLLADNTGVMKVWQNDALLINEVGLTLPRADSIYERLQVGLTANGNETAAQTLYIDDVQIWNQPPGWYVD